MIETPWIARGGRWRVVHPTPGGSCVPERSITPGLARHRAEPMIEDGKLLRERAQDRYRVGRKAFHDLRALVRRRTGPRRQRPPQSLKCVVIIPDEALHPRHAGGLRRVKKLHRHMMELLARIGIRLVIF